MTPRQRKAGNAQLPPNLYRRDRGNGFRYRDPVTARWSYIPGPERAAIAEAKRRNVGQTADRTDTVGWLLEQYRATRLEGSASTLAEADRIIARYARAWAARPIRVITRQVLTRLWETELDGPHAHQKHRAFWAGFMAWCVARGDLDVNEAGMTLPPRLPERARQRHTDEGYAAIYEAAPDWLQIAMELAVSSLQRRGDLVRLTRDDVRDGVMFVRQSKTGARLGIRIPPQSRLGAAVRRAMLAPVFGSTLIRRKPERRKARTNEVTATYLSHAFAEVRDDAGVYAELAPEQRPSLHDLRAYGVWTYERAGFSREYVQALAGHSTVRMTAHYAEGHEEVWSDVEAGLGVGQNTVDFGAKS